MKTVKHASPQSVQEGMVGKSASFNHLLNLINRVAEHDISVLLQGESGTGKELVAHAIHQASSRNEMACVTVECSGLSETLFESELFGHEKGSFTGAVSQKKGLIEEAKGGTLFLDEIGDVPLNLQVKLLRLIETRMFRRVGGVEQLHTNFRLICATHKNLLQMVRMGEFREDLYYRISTFPLHLPALRERIEDIPLLVNTILERITGSKKMQVSDDALVMFGRYYFPGNIRQLRNLLEFGCVMTDSNVIEKKHFPSDLSREKLSDLPSSTIDYDDFESSHRKLMTLEQYENNYINHLNSYFSDKKLLATKLGISERTLYRKLQLCRKQNVGIKESE
jgi:transcriptional regulator with PAS, ATPase and Fis domain